MNVCVLNHLEHAGPVSDSRLDPAVSLLGVAVAVAVVVAASSLASAAAAAAAAAAASASTADNKEPVPF